MSETAMQDFLDQFNASKKLVNDWPQWMQENARVATASFPKPPTVEVKDVVKEN